MNLGLKSKTAKKAKIHPTCGRRVFWAGAALSQREQPAAGLPALLRLARAQNPRPQHPADF